jgi:hypothetical protein
LLKELGQSLAAFHQDMGDRMQDIVVVTMSEFGRTAKENGSRQQRAPLPRPDQNLIRTIKSLRA